MPLSIKTINGLSRFFWLKLVKNLVNVDSPIVKLETAVAYFRGSPQKFISLGISIAPPIIPPIEIIPLNTINTKTPPISIGSIGKVGLCAHTLFTQPLKLLVAFQSL
jgi:hypothetical protein